jgi:fermentation-respiration switch protein FrsA (DUF1100 family)
MALVVWLVAAYALLCAVVYFGNRWFIYFPDPARVAPRAAGLTGVEEIEITTADGIKLVAWHAPAQGEGPTVLYFHGNAANAANRARKIEMIRETGFGVFYLNNRGYGGSGGHPTERSNVADALAAYEHLTGLGVPAGRIVAFGESLGTGQAIRLAAQRPVGAVVLEAPLTSTLDVAQPSFFWLPLRLLVTDTYSNERNICAVPAPVLVLHGERDGVIPVEMGRRVFRAANEPKRIELFALGSHSDLFDYGAWQKAQVFLTSVGV